MKDDVDGKPVIGDSARKLGVRNPDDIKPNHIGVVDSGFHGMSVAPLPAENLPKHRRPNEFGGTGRDPIFGIETVHLGSFNLKYVQDPMNLGHGFIAPLEEMSYTQYVQNVYDTRDLWFSITQKDEK